MGRAVRAVPPAADRAMSPGLQGHAGERSFLPASRLGNVRAAGDFIRARSRLRLNAIADGMLSLVVVLLGVTGVDPVMRSAASLSAATFPRHDPVVAIPILLALALTVLVIASALVKSWANGVSAWTYFADATRPGNPSKLNHNPSGAR